MTFEDYARRRLPVLLGTARAICADPNLAEDLVQDVLIKVHANWPSIRSMDAPDAYVRRMLVNEFISWRRKWSRLVPHAAPTAAFPGRTGPVADHATAYGIREALVDEVRRLPPRQRAAIGLRYFADLSDAEIADALGCGEGTVRVHVSRALTRLRINRTDQLIDQPSIPTTEATS